MYKKLFWVTFIVLILVLGIIVKFFIFGSTEKSIDNRQAINLSREEKNLVLGEMRHILKALNGTLVALGKDDFKEASISLESAGMKMAVDVNPNLMAKLPIQFKQYGMGLHGEFDNLSLAVKNGMKKDEVIKKLGELTNRCVVCHSTYRFNDNLK